ncbi:hypothetical protein ACFYPG_01300 [Micromonospora sp. NPDC005553]|uniref:hypothetical protein n=1 Tax=unclassified Micromonospora TaxID=2617518 RepID=UPI0033A0E8BF
MRDVLLGADPPVTLTGRAKSRLAVLRDDAASVVHPAGPVLVRDGAAPAAADPPGGTLRNVYSDGQFCNSYGSEGVRAGLWSWYYCEYRQYTPNAPGFYFLWNSTY